MKYAYIPATYFQKQIYLSDATSVNKKFDLIWRWQLKNEYLTQTMTPILFRLIDKYEILRTSIVENKQVIVQKIAQEPFQHQVLLMEFSTVNEEPYFLKKLADPSVGITFVVTHNASQYIDTIYGIANHSIIDATSIHLLGSEICYCLYTGSLPAALDGVQFADLTDSLESLEQQWLNYSNQELICQQEGAIQSSHLDTHSEGSITWLSSVLKCSQFLSSLPPGIQLSLLGRLFQQLISKIGVFLNQPILHVAVALDARNFLNMPCLVGPAVLLRKGAFNIRELHNPKSFNILSNFFYESTLGDNVSKLIAPTDTIQVLFNLIIDSAEPKKETPLTLQEFTNDQGASVPLTLDCRINSNTDEIQMFLRSCSSNFNRDKLSYLGNYLASNCLSKPTKPVHRGNKIDLINCINDALQCGGSQHCMHWIRGSEDLDLYYTYDQLCDRVEVYHQFLLNSQIKSCRVLLRCLDPFEYVASLLALVLSRNVYVPIDERRINDTTRVNLIESICDYELSYDSHTRQPILSSLLSTSCPFNHVVNGDDVCIMFTSGSTGTPKGVRITSRGITRLLRLGIERSWDHSNFLMHSDIGFDASLFEIWVPILSGGKIICIDHLMLLQKGVTVDIDCAWLSVSMLTQVLRYSKNILKAKVICTGGEHVPYSLVSSIESCGFFQNGNRLFNGYGPTESTTFIFLDEIDPATYAQQEGVMSHVLPGTQVELQSFLGLETPVGGIGELIVSGDGVANGYLGLNPDCAFFHDRYQQISYRTGDFFEKVSETSYRFIGRADDLVKISGYRVSVEQIRLTLASFIKFSDIFVIKVGDNGRFICVAFVQTSDKVTPDYVNKVVQTMRSKVPHFLIPKQVIPIDNIPITTNGKVDKDSLKQHYFNYASNDFDIISMDELISLVLRRQIGNTHDISHLTHDSLALINLHARLSDIGFSGDLYSLSQCKDTSDLFRLMAFNDSDIASSLMHTSPKSVYQKYIHSSFDVSIDRFDQVSLLCFLTIFFEVSSNYVENPFYLEESSLNPSEYLNILSESSCSTNFPLYCTYTINQAVTVRLYAYSSYFSIFIFEELIQTCRDYLLYKGTVLSRLTKLKTFCESFSTSPIIRDSTIKLRDLLVTIDNSLSIFDFSSFHNCLILLPSSLSSLTITSLFKYDNNKLIPYLSAPGASDIIYDVSSINNTVSCLSSEITSHIIEGSISSSQISWTFDNIILVYNAPTISDLGGFSFRSPPTSWSNENKVDNSIPIFIISPVADDLHPVLPLAKAFASRDYAVTALTYGLLTDPAQDSLEMQTQRIINFIQKDEPCIIIGYSYSGLIVNNLVSLINSNDSRYIIIDTPNPLLVKDELEQLPSHDDLFWLTQVCRRLLKSIDCDDSTLGEIISFINDSSLSLVDQVNQTRYRLIATGAISYSTAVDDILCWVKAAKAQFHLFREYQLRYSSAQITYICALNSNHNISALDSWGSCCDKLNVINVHADHYSILKSSMIEEYIDDLILTFF
jgi:acyl-coenzyme A synthetase/AMP-(fatty) acid ligase/thioesterase domain-containing protein